MSSRLGLVLVVLLARGASAASAPASPLSLSDLEEAQLPEWVWKRSPALVEARLALTRAREEMAKAGLFPNPELDLNVGTLPVGSLNPRDLEHPFANVPNYTAGLSQQFLLGKRGPKQDVAREQLRASALSALALVRKHSFELLASAGSVAAAEVKLSALNELIEDAERLTALQRNRQSQGDAAGLDVDRAILEEEALRTQRSWAQTERDQALRACSLLAGRPCLPFADSAQANAFLESHGSLSSPEEAPTLSQRADLRAIEAERRSARAQERLAHRSVLPDPTLRLGYVRDQFLISGNQLNSLFVGVSVPLPVFDRGRAESAAAAASARTWEDAGQRLREQAERERDSLRAGREKIQEQCVYLHQQTLPLARRVVDQLEQAVRAGGSPLQDLLLARRTLGELLLRVADMDLRFLELTLELRQVRGDALAVPADLSPLL